MWLELRIRRNGCVRCPKSTVLDPWMWTEASRIMLFACTIILACHPQERSRISRFMDSAVSLSPLRSEDGVWELPPLDTGRSGQSRLEEAGTRALRPIRWRMHTPSVTEWKYHRAVITQLYSRLRLKDVQLHMEQQFGFKASRRMYFSNFTQWGVHKNLSASAKDHLDAMLSLPADPLGPARLDVNENIRKRLERHRKARRPMDYFRSWNPHHALASRKQSPTAVLHSLVNDTFLLSSSNACMRSRTRVRPGEFRGTADPAYFWFCMGSLFPLPSRDRASSDLLNNGMVDQPVDSFRGFWGILGFGIHLMKVTHSPQEAFSIINQACGDAYTALPTDTFTFVMGLMTTLSPVNNTEHPRLRKSVLEYLADLTMIRLGRNHPLHQLCSQLLHDDLEASLYEKALSYMLDQRQLVLGNAHPSTPRVRISLVATRLRHRDNDSARRLARDLILACEETYGKDTLSRHSAKRDLEDVLSQSHERICALDTCLSIIWLCSQPSRNYSGLDKHEPSGAQNGSSEASQGELPVNHDCMRIDELTGAPTARPVWLKRAAAVAWVLWGDCVGYRQVADRLTALLEIDLND